MKYVTLSKTGLKVSRLGMGTMRFPTMECYNMVDEEKAVSTLQYALEIGINYIDTGYTYHDGKSEAIVGKAIRPFKRSRLIITTKCPVWEIHSEDDFNRILHEQLTRLGTNYIDCYLIHALGEERWSHVKACGIMNMMEKAQKKGIIRHIGFSFHDTYQVFDKVLSEYPNWEICQLQYNYIDTDKQAGTEGVKLAKAKGLDVFVMEPLHGGRLVNPPIQVKKILPTEKTPIEWAFDFLYDQPQVDVVLSGMGEKHLIDENVSYLDRANIGMLNSVEREMFVEAKKMYDTMSLVKCTGCNYCNPCSQKINIPQIIALYNTVGKSHYREAKEKYDQIENDASCCIECRICETKCPQKLPISQIMKEIATVFQEPAPELDLESLRIKWPARYKRIIGGQQ